MPAVSPRAQRPGLKRSGTVTAVRGSLPPAPAGVTQPSLEDVFFALTGHGIDHKAVARTIVQLPRAFQLDPVAVERDTIQGLTIE